MGCFASVLLDAAHVVTNQSVNSLCKLVTVHVVLTKCELSLHKFVDYPKKVLNWMPDLLYKKSKKHSKYIDLKIQISLQRRLITIDKYTKTGIKKM